MEKVLKLSAMGICLATLAIWFFSGPNMGKTVTSITEFQKIPGTELVQPIERKRILPGVDFLLGGLFLATLAAGSGYILERKNGNSNHQTQLSQ